MSKIVLNSIMGHMILGHLQIKQNFPNEGILAGQSVVSAICELFLPGEINPVYNDFDIFYYDNNTIIQDSAFEYEFSSPENYILHSESREGMLNHISVKTKNLFFDPDILINGFDFNCTQAAIDLKTGILYWTPELESFLNDKQIKLVTLYTPARSAIRYFKKKRELNVGGNDAEIMGLISGMMNAGKQYMLDYFNPLIGDVYLKKFNHEHISEIKNWFSVSPVIDKTTQPDILSIDFKKTSSSSKDDIDELFNMPTVGPSSLMPVMGNLYPESEIQDKQKLVLNLMSPLIYPNDLIKNIIKNYIKDRGFIGIQTNIAKIYYGYKPVTIFSDQDDAISF